MKTVLLAGALLLSSTAAFAADLAPAPTEPVVPVVPFSWTGFYVGAEGGYGWGKSSSSVINLPPAFPLRERSSGNPDGGFGGGFLGYNYQFEGGLVLGAEADINGGSIKSSDNFTVLGFAAGPVVFPGAEAQAKLDWFGAARLRAGYSFDRFLPYIAGGYAYGHVKTFYEAPLNLSSSDTMSGWTIGGGLEYAITDNLLARIEYRYTDYGKKSDVATNATGSGILKRDFTTNDVRVGLSYKF